MPTLGLEASSLPVDSVELRVRKGSTVLLCAGAPWGATSTAVPRSNRDNGVLTTRRADEWKPDNISILIAAGELLGSPPLPCFTCCCRCCWSGLLATETTAVSLVLVAGVRYAKGPGSRDAAPQAQRQAKGRTRYVRLTRSAIPTPTYGCVALPENQQISCQWPCVPN